jgi:FkbM family methyltransferase
MTGYRIALGDQVPGFISRNDLIDTSSRGWDELGTRKVDKFFINFCLSKLHREDAETLVQKAAKALKIGGHLRVADIDANNPDPRYQDKIRPDPFHTSVSSIMEVMGRYGFQSWPLEFHTADGVFHQRPIDPEDGLVTRSRLIDPRARASDTYLSSLVVDGVLSFDQMVSRHRMTPDDIRDVYLGVLDRTPDCEQSISLDIARYDTTGRLATHLLGTSEFQRTLPFPFALPTLSQADYNEIIRGISVNARQGCAGYYVGPLGDSTDVSFASDYAKLGGKVQSAIPPNPEYYAVLKSVLDSDGRNYVAVELGAGHGTWSVRAGLAARKRAIQNVHLVAAEAAVGHFDLLSRHFIKNGFEPGDHTLVKCVIGDQDGLAYFPNLHNPAADWGARAISQERFTELGGAAATDRLGQAYSSVPALSIATLIRPFPRVDLLHIDIQGHELHAVRASIVDIDMKVRSMFIGTHSYQIDSALIRLLNSHGWKALHIIPKSVWRDVAGRLTAAADGEQVWVNPRLQACLRGPSDDNGTKST